MHSLVVGSPFAFFSQSINIVCISSGVTGATSLRFFVLGCPFVPEEPAFAESSALRLLLLLLLTFCPLATGLVGRLPASGLDARLLVGLLPLLALENGLGAFGLVARLATIEWPPKLGDATGDVARELLPSD
jgi:hypothetical protein